MSDIGQSSLITQYPTLVNIPARFIGYASALDTGNIYITAQ